MLASWSCRQDAKAEPDDLLVIRGGEYPYAIFWNDTYYFTLQPSCDGILIYATPDLRQLPETEPKIVWQPDSLNLHDFWAPELYRFNGKWYIYFEADDGNTDNHQLYVIENADDDPMSDHWAFKGALQTNDEWNFGLHPSVLEVRGELYLLWSGWPQRRMERETQCIYIAHLKDPWTVDSERVLLSQPEYEWERQWIDPDGSRSAYPIYVNENPEAYLSPDGSQVILFYSASGIWTRYHILGKLTAPATADLLDPSVWTKSSEPILVNERVPAISNICVVNGRDNTWLLYETRKAEDVGQQSQMNIFLREIHWDDNGELIFAPE